MPKSPSAGGGGRATLNPRAMAAVLGLLRIFVGIKFLLAGIGKWGWFGTAQPLIAQLTRWTTGERPAALDPFIPFLTHTVLPHAPFFAWTIAIGETAVGALLILGLLTRLAALLALVMSLNYLLATWYLGPAYQGYNEAVIGLSVAFLIVGAGRALGLDARLARRRLGNPLW